MNEQQRTKRIALEIEKIEQELARQDAELESMKRDHDVSDEDVEAMVRKIDAKSAEKTRDACPMRPISFNNNYVVRG